MSVLRLGVLGGGSEFARRKMLPALDASPDVEVVAVASRARQRAEEMAVRYGAMAVAGYDALLERAGELGIEAVYLPLPLALHAQWTETALRAGLHVLCEKPIAQDPLVVGQLMRLAHERGLVLAENVLFPHHAQHARVADLVATGAIGELRSVTACFTIPPPPDSDVRHDPALGGGSLSDVGLYPVRAAQLVLGNALHVAGATLRFGSHRGVDTSGAALLHTDDSIPVQLRFGMENRYESSYSLTGSEATLTLDRAFTPPPDHTPVVLLEQGGRTERIELGRDDQVGNGIAAFARAVRGNGLPTEVVDATLRQADLVDRVRRAARVDTSAPVLGAVS